MLLSLLLASQAAPAPKPASPQPAAPKTAPAPQQPTTPPRTTPAAPRPTTARPPAAGSVAGMAITVSDGKGMSFGDVTVELSGGASPQSGKTNEAGQISFPGLRAGTYRLRFSGDTVTAFEREVTLKAGEIAKLPITLAAAAPPKVVTVAAPAPAAPPPPAVGPVGQPQLGSLTKLADQQKNTKERREVLLSCSGNTRNMLLVLTDSQPTRNYEGAEATFYVISGQGAATVGTLESVISPGSFVAVPRKTPFSLARQGRQPLALLWTLSGEPCESAR
jgi:mannose-6-phosphate isomerase-like protein (cupin superfamily)